MKEELELISELNEDYFSRTNDSHNQFYVFGNDFYSEIRFNDVVLYNSENDSLMNEDGHDITLKEFIEKAWIDYVNTLIKITPF